MFTSLFELAKDVAKIMTAPVSIAVDTTRVVTKPLGELAEDCAKEIKDIIK